MLTVIEGLSQPLDFDLRAQFEKPLFRKGVTSLDDLKIGNKLTGNTLVYLERAFYRSI